MVKLGLPSLEGSRMMESGGKPTAARALLVPKGE